MVLTGPGRTLPGLEDGLPHPAPDTARELTFEHAAVSGADRLAQQALHFIWPALQVPGALRAARFRPRRARSTRHRPVVTASHITARFRYSLQGHSVRRRHDLEALQTAFRLSSSPHRRRRPAEAPRSFQRLANAVAFDPRACGGTLERQSLGPTGPRGNPASIGDTAPAAGFVGSDDFLTAGRTGNRRSLPPTDR